MRASHCLPALAALTLAGCDAASASTDDLPSAAAVAADTARDNRLTRADLGRIAGQESAPVWLVVISDFQCPFCKRWHEETGPRIEREFVRSGKVRIAYLNLPISTHRNAPPAHEAAMCAAEQGRFWPVADAIFATQDAWKSRRDAVLYFDSLSVPLVDDAARFRRCIVEGGTRALIDADVQRVTRLGVGSTPTFLVGPQVIVGAQPYEVFRDVLNAAVAAAAQR
ncbi:MAG: thioredoxin domain-containing protein [Gemmatimonadaceae bacterium]|nr:thioredoxin domain-containing protein [Gemmatimonadaceae bacterium]MCW5825897.1 thioredoxin domain-containing protein [Gemmatimonadaceae bacterium]